MQKQVAHIGGSVLKREPCQKCNLPVFLAERLTLGKKLFHRTCLKCARCQSQLTPGSFYETEVDGEFCCETCPDEEKEFTLKERLKSDVSDANKSFTEKLAMFETDGKGLLQKSLSDEEKSKSLKRLTELYSHQDQTYKTNTALSNFINNQVEDDQSSSIKSDDSITSSDEETDNEDPPDLPTTKPPSPSPTISDNVHQQTSTPQTSQFSIKSEHIDIPEPLSESPPNHSSSTLNIFSDNVPLQEAVSVDAFSELLNVTKEESKHIENEDAVDCVPQIRNANISGLTVNSMVRSRLSQFETKIGADQQIMSKNFSKKLNVSEDGDIQADKIEVPAADQIKLISSEVISDTSKYKDETRQDEIFENNVKSEEVNVIDLECTADNHPEESVEPSEPSSIKKNEVELEVDAENEIKLDEAINSKLVVSIESKSPEIKIEVTEEPVKELVVPAPRKRISKIYQDSEDAVKPVPVKRVVKQKKAAKEQPIETTNLTLVKGVTSYPLNLNPFGNDEDDDDDDVHALNRVKDKRTETSCNPFDSSDDEVELEKDTVKKYIATKDLSKSRMSLNPFGSESEDNDEEETVKSIRTPVPTPRKVVASLNPTPEPTPRLSRVPYKTDTPNDVYGSEASLTRALIYQSCDLLSRNTYFHGSTNSLSSSSSSAHRRKKGRAPLPPTLLRKGSNELSVSKESSPSHSTRTSPSPRKKRPAPAPPTPKNIGIKLETIPSIVSTSFEDQSLDETIYVTVSNDNSTQSEAPTANDFNIEICVPQESLSPSVETENSNNSLTTTMRLIPLEASLLGDSEHIPIEQRNVNELDSVVFRRRIVPYTSESPITDDSLVFQNEKSLNGNDDLVVETNARQWQKMKENKETQNKNRQSQISLSSPESDHVYSNKSSFGKWKRRKGPAPALPVPPRKVLQMVPLQEIRHELEVIEGVMLEKMIRERCEGTDPQFDEFGQPLLPPDTPNTKEVEDLILQLFELVNEKNELFRRQAELMYLLEQEQADIEYEIRVLMAQPERNKTDCDKAREEALITRLVEVVQLRNEVIEWLEMDRLREAEEDQSIKQRLELHTAKRDVELSKQTPTKLSKKEKKKQKESKKLFKQKKMDADKDADETEVQTEKIKKKKRKFLF